MWHGSFIAQLLVQLHNITAIFILKCIRYRSQYSSRAKVRFYPKPAGATLCKGWFSNLDAIFQVVMLLPAQEVHANVLTYNQNVAFQLNKNRFHI